MKLAVLPDQKCYTDLITDADVVAVRRLSQVPDECKDLPKVVLFDQYYSREDAEALNHQAVKDGFSMEAAGRDKFSYKGISIVDADIRQIWSKAFVQIYREALCVLSCIRELNADTVVVENNDPWLFLFREIAPQVGCRLMTVDAFGRTDVLASGFLKEEFPSSFTIDFHPSRGTNWKVLLYVRAVNFFSYFVRLFKGKRPFFMFSLYKPLEPLKQDLLSSKDHYPVLHQINQLGFFDMVFRGVKLFSFDYGAGNNGRIAEVAYAYLSFLKDFLRDKYHVVFGGARVSVSGALYSVIGRAVPAAFSQIMNNIDLLDGLFSSGNIKGYFGFCDSPWEERLIIRMCQKYNVPDAIIINGVLGNSFYIEAKTADHVLVYGQSQKDNYLKGHKGKAVIVGNPLYDKAFSRRSSKTVKHPPRKILIGTSDPIPGDLNCQYSATEKFLSDVMNALADLKREYAFEVFLKLHPGESKAFYEWFVKKEGFDVDGIINSGDMQEMLMGYDLLIINHSVAVLEASLMGIPVLYYHPAKQVISEPFNGQGGLVSAFDAEELKRSLHDVFGNKDYSLKFTAKEILEPFTGPLDNGAAVRIKALLKNISGGKK